MEKRIVALSFDPHTVSLADRKCSLFIDLNSGSMFVDEGDGEGRMNGVVFSPANGPSFFVRPSAGLDHQLVLDYRGIEYVIGVSEDGDGLRQWAGSANLLLTAQMKPAGVGERPRSSRKIGVINRGESPHLDNPPERPAQASHSDLR